MIETGMLHNCTAVLLLSRVQHFVTPWNTFTKNQCSCTVTMGAFMTYKLYLKKAVKHSQTSWKFYIVFFLLWSTFPSYFSCWIPSYWSIHTGVYTGCIFPGLKVLSKDPKVLCDKSMYINFNWNIFIVLHKALNIKPFILYWIIIISTQLIKSNISTLNFV